MRERIHESARGFGPEVIQMLIPHRRPLLMVDRVVSFDLEAPATLTASRCITANEEVFDGHFPGWKVWPGVYTIEGLGQSCMILSVLMELGERLETSGLGEVLLVRELRNYEAGFRMRPGFREPASDEETRSVLGSGTYFGMSSVYDIKLFQPVFAGQRLDYAVELTRRMGRVKHFEVEATVDGQPVARGSLGSTTVTSVPRSRGAAT